MAAGATYEPITTQTVTSAVASITLSSISQSYTDLILIINMQSDFTTNNGNAARIRVNGDTANNYSNTNLRGNASTASSYEENNTNRIQIGLLPSSGGGTPVPLFGLGIAHFQNYSNTTTYKTVLSRTNSPYGFIEASAGLWRNTAAITSITYFGDGNIKAGSNFTLYGILVA
jgi:hypothetical protein